MLQADWTTEREAATNKKAELNSEISSLNQKLEDLKLQVRCSEIAQHAF